VTDAAIEETADALVDADVPFEPGSARQALRHRDFRVFWSGTFASNVGTWMQNVVLVAFGYELTHSPGFAGVLTFGQLGPLMFLGPVGGLLADVVDRKRLLVVTQLAQMLLSFALAAIAAAAHPSKEAIAATVLAIGIANALGAPAMPSVLPELVGRDDLPGAVSLMSVQMNLSRVIGPAIGGLLYTAVGGAAVFSVNAVTYLFAVIAIVMARFPTRGTGGRQHVLAGFRIAGSDVLVRRVLVTIAVLSFFSLAFIGLMPALADVHLGMSPRSAAYGLLYAAFGAGAAAGALGVGTVLLHVPKRRLVRGGLVAFAVLLAAFATVRSATAAYPVALGVGLTYFMVVTSLNTVLQQHVDDAVRGRVMSVWIMAFGGTVPLGTLAAGAIATHTSVPTVIFAGAVVAAMLAVYARASGGPRAGAAFVVADHGAVAVAEAADDPGDGHAVERDGAYRHH
jgi:MFS family permease